MTDARLAIEWRIRPIPLTPHACVAVGKVARELAYRLLRLADAELERFQGVAGKGVLIVSGEPEILPWTDGVFYLGRDAAAPALLLPTTMEPSVPVALLESALCRAHAELTPPLAVLAEWRRIITLSAARPLHRQTLLRWLESETP